MLLRDQALVRLREAIVTGELPPGGVVKDAEPAGRLGLSVAPVRTSLGRLADEGLVESKPQSHTRVTAVVPAVVHDAAVVVRAMHELAVATAVPAVTADDVAAMRAANQRIADAVRAGVVHAALDAGDELPDVLVDRCGNGAVRATVDRFTPVVRRLERLRFAAAHGSDSVDLHDQLITACEHHDVEAAVGTTTAIWTALLSELTEETP
ncbi:GntR family transcriptional regulator [Klenkia terrae]